MTAKLIHPSYFGRPLRPEDEIELPVPVPLGPPPHPAQHSHEILGDQALQFEVPIEVVHPPKIHAPQPTYDHLHDRLQTKQGWRYLSDTVFTGAISAPTAPNQAILTPVNRIQPILPGFPGTFVVYLYINGWGIASVLTGTTPTLTGLWSADLVLTDSNYVIPLGVYSGVSGSLGSPDLMSAIPLQDNKDDKTPIANIRITSDATFALGGTTPVLNLRGYLSIAYVYRYIRGPKDEHTAGE